MEMTKWADKKKEAFKTAVMTGILGDLVQAKGGTGELRSEISPSERAKRKKRKNIAKASRRRNR